jgi:hypothetical protein
MMVFLYRGFLYTSDWANGARPRQPREGADNGGGDAIAKAASRSG